jgi:hypothetical protein
MRFSETAQLKRCKPCAWVSEAWAQSSDKRFVYRESRVALRVYERVQRDHPALMGRALYHEIVKHCSPGQPERAEGFVRHAEESFADWPASRDVQYRDVVAYIIFDELVVLRNRSSTSADIHMAVARIIPANL